MLSFSVMDGLKVSSPYYCFLAYMFFSFHLCVKVRLSFFRDVFGLNLERRLFSMFFLLGGAFV